MITFIYLLLSQCDPHRRFYRSLHDLNGNACLDGLEWLPVRANASSRLALHAFGLGARVKACKLIRLGPGKLGRRRRRMPEVLIIRRAQGRHAKNN